MRQSLVGGRFSWPGYHGSFVRPLASGKASVNGAILPGATPVPPIDWISHRFLHLLLL